MKIHQKAAGLSLLTIALLQFCVLTSAGATPANQTSVLAGFGQTPLRFEPTDDQISPQVRYVSRGNGYAMYFLPTEIALALDVGQAPAGNPHQPFTRESMASHKFGLIHIKLEGANQNAVISAEQTLPEKINYFLGNDPAKWRTNQAAYGRVHYQNLYPGIDAVFYGNQTQLEYDFVLAPHADASVICLKLEGADQIKIESDGGLAFSVQGRVSRFNRPVLYQTIGGIRRNIVGSYHLHGNQLKFEIGAYDHNQALVIDPVLSYSTFLGGSEGDYGYCVAVDSVGNAYICGETFSTSLGTSGAFQTSYQGGTQDGEAFVAKIGSTGTNLVYMTYLGGSPFSEEGDGTWGERANAITVDASGNAYVVGDTESQHFPTKNALFPNNPASTSNGNIPFSGFVTELNTNGSQLVFSTYLGGSGAWAFPDAVALDSQDNVYVGGEVAGTDEEPAGTGFPVTNAVQSLWDDPTGYPNPDGDGAWAYDGFVTKFNSNGVSLAYSTFYGGHNEDNVTGLAVDGQGNLYACGFTYSTDFYVTNAVQATNGGGAHDAFVFKLDPTGTNVLFSTRLGGTGDDDAYSIGLDTNGNAYVVGMTFSANFPITNALQTSINGNGSTSVSDAFLTKLTPSGQLVYSTYLGGSNTDIAWGVAVQSDGEVVVVGQTGSTDFAPYDNYGSINSGALDGFVARLSSAGNVLENFAYLGGGAADSAYSVALDDNNNAYVVGYTASSNFPITTNVVQPNYGGGSADAFITKLYFEPNQLGTQVTTTWQMSNSPSVLGPPAVLATSNTWSGVGMIPSISGNGVTSLVTTRLQRGASYDPTFTSFVIPLNQQTGFRLDDSGNNAENFGGNLPWFTRLQCDVRTHLSLVNSTNVAGISTNYYGYTTNFNNPIAAFGATAGQSTLYVNQAYQFGVYCGAQYESSNTDGTVFQSPLRILVYNLTNFVAGQTNLVAPIATNYINIPRRTIPADSTNWYQFTTNGFSVTINTNGLQTTVQLVMENGGAWGVAPSFTNAQSGTYSITEQCTTNLGYGYVLEGVGVVPLSTNLYPMVTNSAGAVGWDRLYTMDFQVRPPWRSIFIDQPQFNGTPMPSFYQGASPSELTNLDAVVTNSIPLTAGIYTNVDDSPELRNSPILNQLVANLNDDPIALANYVVNNIQLSDALAFNPDSGQASAPVVNAGGVNRSAQAVYLEGEGSPVEQCALLVYLLRQAGYPAAYVFPTNNNVEMQDTRLSALLRMQLHGAVNQYGQLYTTNMLITVNYPWVVTTISNQTVHIFPWLKDTQITEGLDLYDYMPTNYNSGFKWLQRYLYGDTNILGLSAESDAPSVLFPLFVNKQLLTNAPGISLDDIGINAFNRQDYYSSWQAFPTPTVVNNPTQVVCVDTLTSPGITNISPGLTNFFDTVTLTIYSQNNPTNQISVGPLRMADLHNRELFVATNGAGNLMLWLAPYVAGNTNQGSFSSSDLTLTNIEVAILTLSSNDVSFEIYMTHYRHQAVNFSPSNQFLNVSEALQFSTPPRPFNLQDIAAICFNVGQVTPAMLNVNAQTYQQTGYQWSLNTNSIPPVQNYQGMAAYLMGVDYYSHVSAFLPVCEQLHKAQVVSWYAEGLCRLTPVQLGSQSFMRPSMDMFYSEMAHAGNGTSLPNSGNDTLAGTDDFSSIMDGEIAAQEHGVINGYYQSQNAVSAVVLLRLAQQESTNGGAGILELNNNNYLAMGATNPPGAGPTLLMNYDPTVWAAVTNAFSGWDAPYVHAYITPGPLSVAVASYRGMGLVVVGKGESASVISVNMNGVVGQPSPYFASTPAALSTAYAASAPLDDVSADDSFSASAGDYGSSYDGSSFNNGSDFNYYWTTPDWFDGSPGLWPYIMPVDQYEVTATFTPPSQINLAQQIDDLYYFPQSTPVTTSLTQELSSGNTGPSSWKNLANYVYEPVSVLSGEFYEDKVDLTMAGPMPLQLRRNYSSQNQDDRNGFGYGWCINLVPYITIATNTALTSTNVILSAVELDGSVIAYRQQATNVNLFLPQTADNPQLDNDGNGHIGSVYNPFNANIVYSTSGTNQIYTLTQANGQTRTYIVNSYPVVTPTNTVSRQRPYLATWQDTQGNSWTFNYDTNSSDPAYGSVTHIQSSNGNYLNLDYNAGGYVIDAYTSDGQTVSYQYDDFGDLVLAVAPDESEETYEYQHTPFTNNGTLYVDSTHLLVDDFKPDGRVVQNAYDSQRRVVSQMATVGQDLNLYTNAIFTYANNFALTNAYTNHISGHTLITDVNGNTLRYDYTNSMVTTNTDELGQQIIQSWYADNAASPGYPRSLYQRRDKRGLWTQYQYDASGNLTNSFSWGDLTGSGVTQYATNTASYNTNNLPVQMTDPVGNSIQTVYAPQYPYLPEFVIFAPGGTPTITNQYIYGNATNVVQNGKLTTTNTAFGLRLQQIRAVNSPDAATNQWSFDGRGYLTQSVQFTGTGDTAVTNTFVCDNQGRIVQRTDAAGQMNQFGYDDMNRPISHEAFAAGQAVSMFSEFAYYNDNGELNWYQGPQANPENYQWYDYDGAGRLTTEIDWRAEANAQGTGVEAPAGYNLYAQTFFQYDKFGDLVLTVDPRGAMTTNTWDKIGQLVQRQHLDTNGVTLLSSEGFAHEPGGMLSAYTNALGGVTTIAYTTNGLPKFRRNADGSTNGWLYYLDGRINQEIQGNGAYWQTTYNDVNRTTTRTFYSAAGVPEATNSVQLDRRGNVVQLVDEGGNVFSNAFDGLDRPKVTAGPVVVTVTSYSGSGMTPGTNITYVTNTLQQAVTYYYDAAGLVLTNVNAAGESTVTSFDPIGRPTQTEIFSSLGTLVRQQSIAYSQDYHSVTTVDGSGTTAITNTSYVNNDGQNVLAVAYPSAGVNEFKLSQFDLAGNLVAEQHDSSASGAVTTWTTASYSYDGLNRLTGKIDRDGASTTYGYDPMGDLTNRTIPFGLKMLAAFNNAGQVISDWSLGGTSGTRTNTYTYFASTSPFAGLLKTKVDGRLTTNSYAYDDWLRVTNRAATGLLPEQNLTTSWQFEPRGYLTNYSEQFASTNTGPTTSVQRVFDPYGQLAAENITENGVASYGASQSWDATGRRTQLSIDGANYGFGWQADGSLIYAGNPTGSGAYSYDTAGLLTNRLVGNRVTTIASRDGEGRPLTINTTVNAASELGETLGYSGDGLLTTHTLVRGDFTDNRNYAYANLSRRLTQEQLNLNASSTWTNSFLYDRGVASGPGALTTAGPTGANFGLWWSGLTDAFSRVNTETNNAIGFLAYGLVNGQSTLSAYLDNQAIQILEVGTNAMQWRTFLELSQGPHQLQVNARHPSGFFTATATNSFTNNITYQVAFDQYDAAGNITNRVYRNASGATNRTQTLSWDAEGRLRLVMERNTNNYGFNWSAVYDGLNRRISTTIILVSNGVPSVVPPQMLSSYYDPQTECLELGVLLTAAPQQEFLQSEASPGIQTTWKLYGPDLNGQYGGLNGVGGLDAVSPYQNNFDPVISDARGNVLAEETNGVPYWTLARPTGYGAVPGYRPVAFGNGVDLAHSSAWRGHEVDVTGFYYLDNRYYDPVGGQWLSFDPLPNDLDPNGQSFVGGDPVNYFDPDGRYGKGAAVSAGNMLSSAASFAKNTLYAMSYAVSSPFAPDWAYRNYGQQTAAFGNSVKGAAQTTYDVAAMASYGITSPFAPNFAYNNYGGSMERLEKVATALSAGGANNPGAYRAGYTTFNVATVFFGGEVGEVGNAGRAGEVTGVAAQTARTGGLYSTTAAEGGVQTLDANAIRFSQSSVNGVGPIADSMAANGWQGAPVTVVQMADGSLVTVDNTRVLAASLTGTPVQATVMDAGATIDASQAIRFVGSDGSLPTTWGDAVLNRIANQNTLFRTTYPSGSPFTGVSSW